MGLSLNKKYNFKKISLVIPCNNEENGIKKILKNKIDIFDEIIIVDNNSNDNTAMVAKDFGVKVIKEKRKGYGYSLRSGIKYASGDIIVIMDGDNTYSIEDSKILIKKLIENNLDFVFGSRIPLRNKKSMSLRSKFGNIFLTLVFNVLTGKNIVDSQSGMFVAKKNAWLKLKLISNGFSLPEEIKMEVIIKNLKFAELPISYGNRVGQSKLNHFKDGICNFIFLFKKRFFIK